MVYVLLDSSWDKFSHCLLSFVLIYFHSFHLIMLWLSSLACILPFVLLVTPYMQSRFPFFSPYTFSIESPSSSLFFQITLCPLYIATPSLPYSRSQCTISLTHHFLEYEVLPLKYPKANGRPSQVALFSRIYDRIRCMWRISCQYRYIECAKADPFNS